jgi:hypothetical protein
MRAAIAPAGASWAWLAVEPGGSREGRTGRAARARSAAHTRSQSAVTWRPQGPPGAPAAARAASTSKRQEFSAEAAAAAGPAGGSGSMGALAIGRRTRKRPRQGPRVLHKTRQVLTVAAKATAGQEARAVEGAADPGGPLLLQTAASQKAELLPLCSSHRGLRERSAGSF